MVKSGMLVFSEIWSEPWRCLLTVDYSPISLCRSRRYSRILIRCKGPPGLAVRDLRHILASSLSHSLPPLCPGQLLNQAWLRLLSMPPAGRRNSSLGIARGETGEVGACSVLRSQPVPPWAFGWLGVPIFIMTRSELNWHHHLLCSPLAGWGEVRWEWIRLSPQSGCIITDYITPCTLLKLC